MKLTDSVWGDTWDALDEVIDHFNWSRDGSGDLGQVSLDRATNTLQLRTYVLNNDDPDDDEYHGLRFVQDVDCQEPKAQIRELIHNFLCHEADEQMWFAGEQTFYPHEQHPS